MNIIKKYIDVNVMINQVSFWTPIRSNPPYGEIKEYLSNFESLKDFDKQASEIYMTINEIDMIFNNPSMDSELRTAAVKPLRQKLRKQLEEI